MSRSGIVISLLFALFLPLVATAQVARTPSAKNASIYIISPKNGENVSSPFTVRFGLKNMGIAPAGVKKPNTGHHHLLIDSSLPKDLNLPLPSDKHHKHFGGGQTEVELRLPPGEHSLQLLLADYRHIPHLPVVKSKAINIKVVK